MSNQQDPRDEETINTAFVFYLFKLKTCEVSTFNFQLCCVGLANLASLTSSGNANRNSVPFPSLPFPSGSVLLSKTPRCAAFLLICISTRR